VRASSSERIRVEKLRRYNTFEILLKDSTRVCAVECSNKSCKHRRWRASSEKGYLAIFEKFFKEEEIDGQDLTEKIDEIPSAVRSQEVVPGLSPSVQKKSPGEVIGISESSGFC
jgi:hypothetical protein